MEGGGQELEFKFPRGMITHIYLDYARVEFYLK